MYNMESGEISIIAQADAWIKMTKIPWDDQSDEAFQEGFALNDHACKNPEFAWAIIVNIVQRFEESDVFLEEDTEAKKIISNLGSGPLEELMSEHGEEYIEKIEKEARENRVFFWMLGCVWQNSMPDSIWSRIVSASGGISR